MNTADEYRGAIALLRDQLWSGHLTLLGIQRGVVLLTRNRAAWPADMRADADWLLAQLDAELQMRELDTSETAS